MAHTLKRLALLAAAVALPPQEARQTLTEDVVEDPDAAVFVTEDVENFLWAMEQYREGRDLVEVLQDEYFDVGSPGLDIFVEKYGLTAERLATAITQRPREYDRIAGTLELLERQIPDFREGYTALQELIPDAVFPPTYFLVAGYRGIGSGSVEGTLITIEKETEETIRSDLRSTLIHEMVHMQQLAVLGEDYFDIFSGPERTLLALSVREGVATYFTELVTGGSAHKNVARDYLLAHEASLWAEFREVMLGQDTGDWLWERPRREDQPQDVGYALGARIAQAYYEKAADKQKAVAAILSIRDYPDFLRRSGYGQRWRSEGN